MPMAWGTLCVTCSGWRLAPTPPYTWSAPAGAYASVKFRVTAGSTGMPGPVVVDTTTFFR